MTSLRLYIYINCNHAKPDRPGPSRVDIHKHSVCLQVRFKQHTFISKHSSRQMPPVVSPGPYSCKHLVSSTLANRTSLCKVLCACHSGSHNPSANIQPTDSNLNWQPKTAATRCNNKQSNNKQHVANSATWQKHN